VGYRTCISHRILVTQNRCDILPKRKSFPFLHHLPRMLIQKVVSRCKTFVWTRCAPGSRQEEYIPDLLVHTLYHNGHHVLRVLQNFETLFSFEIMISIVASVKNHSFVNSLFSWMTFRRRSIREIIID
jgi:hypothetical protein